MQCLTNDNPNKAIEISLLENNLSLSKCLSIPSIYELKKQSSPKTILLAIQQIILNTAKTFKYSENMDYSQSAILASDLLDYFKHESMEDIALMFKMARQGELGSGKGRLDHDVVFNIFVPAYLNKKAEARERQAALDKKKYNSVNEPMSEKAKQKFEELSQMLSIKKTEEPVKPVVNHHQVWINKLKDNVKKLSLEQLYEELEKAENADHSVFAEAVKIYREEIELRKN